MTAGIAGHIEIKETKSQSTTDYELVGLLEDVLAEIDRLFKNYHPAGYGTHVSTIHYDYKSGGVLARMSRSNSCD